MTSHRHILNCIGELIRRKTIQTPNWNSLQVENRESIHPLLILVQSITADIGWFTASIAWQIDSLIQCLAGWLSD
jgi:hypothetical protein